MRKCFFLFLLFSLICCGVYAQSSNLRYDKNYFQWPVNAKIGLAANFGELRPNHFHMGLDCRTDQRENVDVLAAADGYVAKVKIEPFGFGRCIYINHPNGHTTVYAHLNAFEPKLEKYITDRQYELKQWKVFLDIPANLFPVSKGDFIAASGNTGGSQGPHLHFEIRDTKTDKNLNPLLFSFPIQDNIAPDILRLAMYDRTKSTYNQSPKFFTLKKLNGVYIPTAGEIIATSNKVSFAVTAYDRYTGSSNQNGIYAASVTYNDVAVSSFKIDQIGYDDTRYMNAHIDYKVRSAGGPYLQHLSALPGYENSIYQDIQNGIINLSDSSSPVEIAISDANDNVSLLRFKLKPSIFRTSSNSAAAIVFTPGFINIFDNNKVRFYLPENALYDTVHFLYNEIAPDVGKTIYQLHNTSVPVQTYFNVGITDNFKATDTSKMLMKRFAGGKIDFKKAVWKNGFYSASFREFGNFQLVLDTIRPVVNPIGFRDGMNAAGLRRILFSVSDNGEDIETFTALLDGNWLRFTNDKARNFIYNFDEKCAPGDHILQIKVIDLVGNITDKTYRFSR